jgi:hypothetical protein
LSTHHFQINCQNKWQLYLKLRTKISALEPSNDKNCESESGRGIELALVSSFGGAKIVDPGRWAAM